MIYIYIGAGAGWGVREALTEVGSMNEESRQVSGCTDMYIYI